MLNKFIKHITKHNLFTKTDKLLLAFSGGVDSVVLAHLLNKASYEFELAHCNFQLRGSEAIDDTAFCEDFAKQLDLNCFVNYFDTKQYATENKLSIQMAARKLRYNWFNELLLKHQFTYLLTAHHANDNVETLLVNLVRGTGIKGLQGIPQNQNNILRPLLVVTKVDILNYANANNLAYREDSSNQEVKYKRNFLRHNIIPQLKTLNPALEETITTSVHFFKQAADIVTEFANQKFKTICSEGVDELKISIKLILSEPQKETLLFEWLNCKGFKNNQIELLCNALLLTNNSGKLFITSTHVLLIDREFIFVRTKSEPILQQKYSINDEHDTLHLPIKLSFTVESTLDFILDKTCIQLPKTVLIFPLTLRRWKQGDKFKPFGMNGFKKLSDYFKDKKFTRFEKENCWILENNLHIIWIVGHRMDNRCRVNEGDDIVRISCS